MSAKIADGRQITKSVFLSWIFKYQEPSTTADRCRANVQPGQNWSPVNANQFRSRRRQAQRYVRIQTPGITDNRALVNSFPSVHSTTLRAQKTMTEAVTSSGMAGLEVNIRAVRGGTMTTDACSPQPLFIQGLCVGKPALLIARMTERKTASNAGSVAI